MAKLMGVYFRERRSVRVPLLSQKSANCRLPSQMDNRRNCAKTTTVFQYRVLYSYKLSYQNATSQFCGERKLKEYYSPKKTS